MDIHAEFMKWYNETYPDTNGKYDAVNVAARSAAAFGYEAGFNSGAKHERNKVITDVLNIISLDLQEDDLDIAHVIEEIEKLRSE